MSIERISGIAAGYRIPFERAQELPVETMENFIDEGIMIMLDSWSDRTDFLLVVRDLEGPEEGEAMEISELKWSEEDALRAGRLCARYFPDIYAGGIKMFVYTKIC